MQGNLSFLKSVSLSQMHASNMIVLYSRWSCACFHQNAAYDYLRSARGSSEKAMAPHSRTLAWKIPWTEEPGRLQSMRSLRVGHDCSDLAAAAFLNIFPGGASGKEPTCQCRRPKKFWFDSWVGNIPWKRAQQPTPVFMPGESHGQRSLLKQSVLNIFESLHY